MAVYTGDNIYQLDITTPTEGNPPSELNDADREVKKVLKRQYAIAALTGATTLDTSHSTVICNSASAFTVTLPTPSTVANATHKKEYTINNKGAGVVTIGGTIDGVVNPTLAQNTAMTVYTDGTSWYEKKPTNATNATNTRNIRDISRGLVVKNNTAYPNQDVNIDADELILQDSSGAPYKATVTNVIVDVAASGLNGLDTGTEAASTWYYIWVICNGTTVAGLLSVSSTAPTMPTGYTYKALVGAIYNNSISNFKPIYQQGNRVRQDTAFLVAVTEASMTAKVLPIPVTAKRVIFTLLVDILGTTHYRYIHPTSSITAYSYYNDYVSTSDTDVYVQGECLIETPQTVYAMLSVGAVNQMAIQVQGWEY